MQAMQAMQEQARTAFFCSDDPGQVLHTTAHIAPSHSRIRLLHAWICRKRKRERSDYFCVMGRRQRQAMLRDTMYGRFATTNHPLLQLSEQYRTMDRRCDIRHHFRTIPLTTLTMGDVVLPTWKASDQIRDHRAHHVRKRYLSL